MRKAYRFYAPVYNYLFGRIVDEGRREAVARFRQKPGDRILEIGVGTGLSLPFYDPGVEVTGVDVSTEMLGIARRRYLGPKYPHVRALMEMDAQDLDFPDDYFEGSVAMYVASVVPDPARMIREMFRVTRPGAPVLVVNHFASGKSILRRVESGLARFSKKLGFRPDFSLDRFVELAGSEPVRITRVNLGKYWRLLEFRAPDSPTAPAREWSPPPLRSGGGAA
ncbi:MAG: class I SAM-dependent methyltransferase [Puniceicoccaceae bacterium]